MPDSPPANDPARAADKVDALNSRTASFTWSGVTSWLSCSLARASDTRTTASSCRTVIGIVLLLASISFCRLRNRMRESRHAATQVLPKATYLRWPSRILTYSCASCVDASAVKHGAHRCRQ